MTRPFLNNYSLRIADPVRSLKFYESHFGMTLLNERKTKQGTTYTLGLTGSTSLFKTEPYYNRDGLLELTHSADANVETFKANSGNKEPYRGFGHVSFSVADLPAFCNELESNGVQFQKRIQDGRQHNIAFALDPDGYWIELISNTSTEGAVRCNHAMIRVKDRDLSLDFYTHKLGMSVVDISDHPNGKFTNYFLSFNPAQVKEISRALTEGLVELTYNWGSEKDADCTYYTGNEPQALGFNHLGVTVEDPKAFVETLKAKQVQLKSEENGVYTVLDPDGYYIQIAPQSKY